MHIVGAGQNGAGGYFMVPFFDKCIFEKRKYEARRALQQAKKKKEEIRKECENINF